MIDGEVSEMDLYVVQGFCGDDKDEQIEGELDEKEIQFQLSVLREDLSEGEDGICEPSEGEASFCCGFCG